MPEDVIKLEAVYSAIENGLVGGALVDQLGIAALAGTGAATGPNSNALAQVEEEEEEEEEGSGQYSDYPDYDLPAYPDADVVVDQAGAGRGFQEDAEDYEVEAGEGGDGGVGGDGGEHEQPPNSTLRYFSILHRNSTFAQ